MRCLLGAVKICAYEKLVCDDASRMLIITLKHLHNISLYDKIKLRQHRTKIVVQIRSQIFRQITAQRLWYRYAVRFFVRLPKFTAGILTYFKVNLGNMTENLQVDVPHSSQAVFVRCCLTKCKLAVTTKQSI